MIDRLRQAARWFVTDPDSGNIVIAQTPNATLTGFIVAKIAGLLLSGTPGSVAAWAATAFLLVWAGDEVVRGVNPWRRTLGSVIVLWQVFRVWVRLT